MERKMYKEQDFGGAEGKVWYPGVDWGDDVFWDHRGINLA